MLLYFMLYNQTTYNLNSEKITDDFLVKFKNNFNSLPEYEALRLAFETNDLKDIEEFSQFIRNKFKTLLVLGIGGSSLGAKTLLSIKNNSNVLFLENIDAEKVEQVFNSIDLKNTAFLTVSKSGKTIECISQTLLLLNMFQNKFGDKNIKDHFFFLTEDKESPLTQLAKQFGIKTLAHNKNVGGRFSYLSNVGLIPASVAGLNVKEIREGAKDSINFFLDENSNFIQDIIAKQNILYKNVCVGNVMMTYQEKMLCLTDWYRQLWAESLGKDGFGTVPIQALGTVDQHSQLQLYLGGRKNLFFTFFIKDKDEKALKINNTYIKDFDYLKNITLDDIMEIESKSTVEILVQNKLPVRVINYKEVNERFISQLMMQFIIETIMIGIMNNINPFGQPNVEARKNLAKEMWKK